MSSIKKLLLIFFWALIGSQVHAADDLVDSEFHDVDPMAGEQDDEYGKFAITMLVAIKKNPHLPDEQLENFVEVFRGILLYARVSNEMVQHFAQLSNREFFDEALKHLTTIEIETGIRYYGKLLKENEFDTLVNDITFDYDTFEQFGLDYLHALQVNPVLARNQFVEFLCIFRAIATTLARMHDDVLPLLISLPIDEFFSQALKHLGEMYFNARDRFEEMFTKDPKETFSEDDFWQYVQEEGNTMFASNLLLYLAYLYKMENLYPLELKEYEPYLSFYSQQSESRLFSALQINSLKDAFDKLAQLSKDESSMFYLSGRFAAAGTVVTKIADMRSKIATEKASLTRRVLKVKSPIRRKTRQRYVHHGETQAMMHMLMMSAPAFPLFVWP